MLSDVGSSDPNRRSLQIIEEETKRCEKIVQDLLARLYHPGVANLHLNQCWRGGEPFNNV